ncbi:MAG TPA: M1 family metallopeptidase [Pyrinomonadaceae bacterium]|jgi:aminopeptidase N
MILLRHAGKVTLLLVITFSVSTLHVLAARVERKVDSWKPTHYNVEITLNEPLSELTTAKAEISVQILKNNVSIIDLDFGEMTVDSVKVEKQPVLFNHTSGRLEVRLARPLERGAQISIEVVYHGKPKDGLVMRNDKDGRPSVVGDNWPDRVHHWIPSLDHPSAKATVNFSITAPKRALVVANGKPGPVETTSETTRTWKFTEAHPIPPYCMIFAAGEFAKIPGDSTLTSLSYLVPKSDAVSAAKGFAPAAPSLKLFTQTIAPYPYEKLALIVGNTQFGGMENSGAIVFASDILNRSSNSPSSRTFGLSTGLVELVAHEIAHQWFGDSVTESTWADLWLSEGFATYFAGYFVQKTDGEAAFQNYMNSTGQTYLSYARQVRTPLHDTETSNLMRLLNPNNYQKGAWVLHMLRSELGDEAFFKGIRSYYNDYKNSVASSDDLRSALEKSSGQDLKPFFKAWVYGPGHPHYQMNWEWDESKRVVRVTIYQVQTEELFPNTIPLAISVSSGKQLFKIKPSTKQYAQEIPLAEKPSAVDFDPESSILKEVSNPKTPTKR